MKFFYDTEFLEDGRTIELISIGVVAEDGPEFYAVNRDMPVERIHESEWLMREVWPHLPTIGDTLDVSDPAVKSRAQIRDELEEFLLGDNTSPELWAWYAAYDHVAFTQLWGRFIDLPPGIPWRTNDIKQETERLSIPDDALPKQLGGLHHSLADARWNRDVYYHCNPQ